MVLVPLQIGVVFNPIGILGYPPTGSRALTNRGSLYYLCRKTLLNQYFLVILMSKNLPRYTTYLNRWAQFWTTNSEDKIYNTIVTSN